jgi:Cysteine-rich secretory protein family
MPGGDVVAGMSGIRTEGSVTTTQILVPMVHLSSANILQSTMKPGRENAGGIRAGTAVAAETLVVERNVTARDRKLQQTADLRIKNNCGFDAYIGIMYSTATSDEWYRWPFIGNGGIVTIQDVADPIFFIYGLKASNYYDAVWRSKSSDHCFSAGDCLSRRNAGDLSSGNVLYKICGSSRPIPMPIPAPSPVVIAQGDDAEWLSGHNTRRTQFFAKYGKGPLDLKLSYAIKNSAQNYANKLIQLGGGSDCQIQHGYQGDDYGGENLAASWGYGSGISPPTPEQVLNGWFDQEIGLPYGQNGHATQVVFRSTRYFGCAAAQKDLDNGGKCFIQVCRYISPGNCNMASGSWLQRTLDDTVICSPACPDDGCT